jgi:hypothetical protein
VLVALIYQVFPFGDDFFPYMVDEPVEKRNCGALRVPSRIARPRNGPQCRTGQPCFESEAVSLGVELVE